MMLGRPCAFVRELNHCRRDELEHISETTLSHWRVDILVSFYTSRHGFEK